MSTYEQRLDAVEKDIAVMKRGIIDKFGETNSALTIMQGVVGAQGQDIKKIFVQLKKVNVHLESLDLGLEDVRQVVERQGEDIKALRGDVGVLKEDVSVLKEELGTVKTSVEA